MSYIIAMADEKAQQAQINIQEASKSLSVEAQKLAEERDYLERQKADWQSRQKDLEQKSAFGPDVLLDVGGVKYRVARATLTQDAPRSEMLQAMFSGRHPSKEKKETPVHFLDRNGKIFEHVVDYLRVGSHAILKFMLDAEPQRSMTLYQLHEEANYFQMPDLTNDIRMLAGTDGPDRLKQLLVPSTSLIQKAGLTKTNIPPQTWKRDYGEYQGQEITTTVQNQYDFAFIRGKAHFGTTPVTKIACDKNSTFKLCDLSGVTFKQCYFAANVSFTGSVMMATAFEECAGLVENKVIFSEKQIRESAIEEELADALRQAGCVVNSETVAIV